MTGVTRGAETGYLSWASEFNPDF